MKKLVDLHNDFITKFNDVEVVKYLHECEEQNVKIIVASIYTSEFKKPMEEVKFHMNRLKVIKTKIKLLIHIEDLAFLDENNLDEFISLSPYSCGLVWNSDNCICGGAFGTANLTSFGKLVIIKLIENNIIIDLAHANKASFNDAARLLTLYSRPLLVTHTAFNALHEHNRNLDDEQIAKIIKSNGLVGLCIVGDFLNKKNNAKLEDYKKHLNYFINKFGDKNIAIGTDFNGTDDMPLGLNKYSDLEFIKNNNILSKNFHRFNKL